MTMYTRRVDKSNIISIIMIIILSIMTDVMWIKLIELEKRQQARYNLEQMQHCVLNQSKELTDIQKFHICTSKSRTSKSRTSATGDVYVLDVNTLKFVHENSNDIPQELLFTKESIGKYFKDWDGAEFALNTMLLGKDSSTFHNASYNFDGDTEWLEWKYSPNDIHTTAGKYIIVQGIKKDEVLSYYTYVRLFATVVVILVIFTLLISHNIKFGINMHRRRRDAV